MKITKTTVHFTPPEISFLKKALKLFLIDDIPAYDALTPFQKAIFLQIVLRKQKRLQIICTTQYGKSLVVALACLYLSCIKKEVVSIVAPSKEKAKIIMRYYIDHLGDNAVLKDRLNSRSKLDRLKQEGSKDRIILNNGGGIFVVSTDERNSFKSLESAMGFGSKIVIGDEFCLVNDNTEATIFRMIAGKGEDAIYIKIGNPFYSEPPYSHFKTSWESGRYATIFVDAAIGLQEGRYTSDFLEEAATKPMYDVLYECKFPSIDTVDKEGYRKLCLATDLVFGQDNEDNDSEIHLGIDVAGGGDRSTFICRKGSFAWIESVLLTDDTMIVVEKAEEIISTYKIKKQNVHIDDTGIGRGASDLLRRKGYYSCNVSFGESAFQKDLYANRRAEMYWDMSQWCKNGGVLSEAHQKDWIEVTWTRYKNQTGNQKIILEEKDRVKQRHKKSPDVADGLALTFYKSANAGIA